MAPLRRRLAAIPRGFGRASAWLIVPMVAGVFGLVVARYAFGLGLVALAEAMLWLHAAFFLLMLGPTALADGHVRIDLFRNRLGERGQAWIEVIGSLLFGLPFCAFWLIVSLPYTIDSFGMGEVSREPGGLPAIWLLKAFAPLGAALLALALTVRALAAIAVLRGDPGALNGAEAGRRDDSPA